MAWIEWAVSGAQTTPADTTTTDTTVLNGLIDGTKSDGTWRNGKSSALNADDVYPAVRTGDPPDQWYLADATLDAFAYITDPQDAGGVLYQITQGYREMTYEEARAQAKSQLFARYDEYRQSYFQAATIWFSANASAQNGYQRNETFIRRQIAKGNPTWTYSVIDVDDNVIKFETEAEWNSFLDKWNNLEVEAQTDFDTHWTAVKNATTTAEVRTIMDNLPPIPAPPA